MNTAFLGLEPAHRDPARAAAAILPVPYDRASSWKRGAAAAPAAILEASEQLEVYDIESRSEPWLQGIATLPAIVHDGDPVDLARLVAGHVEDTLARSQLPVVLGGDHSVSIGAIQAAARRFPDLTVLQLDAHADLRDSYDGSTHNHACVMARAREVCDVVQVGIRSIDPGELDRMDHDRVVWAHEIHAAFTPADWQPRVLEALGPEVYVTVDVDVFDPTAMPATGTPEPGGLGWHDVVDLVQAVAASHRIVGFDVVELLPTVGLHHCDFLAAKLVHRLVALALSYQPST